MSDQIEKKVEKKVKPDTPQFDWVTARSLCSLPNVFRELRLQVEEDVKLRNVLRPNNSPYEFSVAENGAEFTVLLEGKDLHTSVTFSLTGHAIAVRGENQKFEVTLTFNDEGACKLNANEKQCELWQVRRMALEDLFFRGY